MIEKGETPLELYFLHSILALSFSIDVVLTLFIDSFVWDNEKNNNRNISPYI